MNADFHDLEEKTGARMQKKKSRRSDSASWIPGLFIIGVYLRKSAS
jgi:hypothetical protein